MNYCIHSIRRDFPTKLLLSTRSKGEITPGFRFQTLLLSIYDRVPIVSLTRIYILYSPAGLNDLYMLQILFLQKLLLLAVIP